MAEMAACHSARWDSPRFKSDLQKLRPAFAWQDILNRRVGFEKRTLTGLERAKDAVPASLYEQGHRLYGRSCSRWCCIGRAPTRIR